MKLMSSPWNENHKLTKKGCSSVDSNSTSLITPPKAPLPSKTLRLTYFIANSRPLSRFCTMHTYTHTYTYTKSRKFTRSWKQIWQIINGKRYHRNRQPFYRNMIASAAFHIEFSNGNSIANVAWINRVTSFVYNAFKQTKNKLSTLAIQL